MRDATWGVSHSLWTLTSGGGWRRSDRGDARPDIWCPGHTSAIFRHFHREDHDACARVRAVGPSFAWTGCVLCPVSGGGRDRPEPSVLRECWVSSASSLAT